MKVSSSKGSGALELDHQRCGLNLPRGRFLILSIFSIYLLAASFPNLGWADSVSACPDGPQISQETHNGCVPEVLPQNDTQWCFLHAAHAIAQQHHCLTGLPRISSKLSLRGILTGYSQSLLANAEFEPHRMHRSKLDESEAGSSFEVLDSINGKIIASEECAPSADFLKWRSLLPANLEGSLNPTDILRFQFGEYQLNRKYRGLSKEMADCILHQDIINNGPAPGLDRFAEDVVQAAGKSFAGTAENFVELALVPEHCNTRASKLAPMKLASFMPQDIEEAKEKIELVVSKGRMVGVNLCANILLGEPKCPPISGHAVVVADRRTVCCGSKCEVEFKVLDSAFFGKPGEGQEGHKWFPANAVARATVARTRYQASVQQENNEMILWLQRYIRTMQDHGVDPDAREKALARNAPHAELVELALDNDLRQVSDLKRRIKRLELKNKSLDTLYWVE